MISIKVLVVTTTFPRWINDSTPSFVYELSKRLQERGFEIVVLTPHDQGAKRFEMMNGMRVYRFPYFHPLKYQCLCYNGGMLPKLKKNYLAKFQLPLFMLLYIYYTLKTVKTEKIDLIHAHWIIPSGFVCSIVKQIIRKPLIVSVHGSDIALIKNPLFKSIGKLILRSADIYTVNSTATKSSVLDVSKSNKDLMIIPMGVDLDLFKPSLKRTNNSEKSSVILTVGRLDKNKGINYLINAMTRVISKFSETKLIIVGDGPERDNLANQIKKLHLEENIKLVGAIKKKDLPEFYNKADLFVLPSLNEGLGIVLLEAMACGTPVIGSNVGGVSDIIINGENGFFIKPGDSKDIAEKIILCLSDKTIIKMCSIKGLNTVNEKFAWYSIAEKFSNVYRVLQHG